MTEELARFSLEELPDVAMELLNSCENKKIFAFLGDMGSGKTTIIGAICQALGVKGKVSSPTFAIVNEYRGKEKVFHLDMYRIKSISEALDIGIEEYLLGKNYCFIEWPQIIQPLLPPETVFISIEVQPDYRRRLTIQHS